MINLKDDLEVYCPERTWVMERERLKEEASDPLHMKIKKKCYQVTAPSSHL
jgi:hypothetical protein